MFHQKSRYLGHIVSEEGVEPDPTKITIITMDPTNGRHGTKAISWTLYLLSTIHAQILHYCRTTVSTYWGESVTKGKRQAKICMGPPWEWTDECNAAFNKLKNTLTDYPVLGYPDFRQP